MTLNSAHIDLFIRGDKFGGKCPGGNVWIPVCTCTQVIRLAHTRKLGALINVSSKNDLAYISYTSFHIPVNSGKMLHKRNFMHTETLQN